MFTGNLKRGKPATNVSRIQTPGTVQLLHPVSKPVEQARRHLADSGWCYREAARHLGCSFTQLAHVLTGRRVSHSLVARILALPPRVMVKEA